MRFIAFAPAQAGLSLFAHLFFPFTPAMNIPFTNTPCRRLLRKGYLYSHPHKKGHSYPNHSSIKHALRVFAPKGYLYSHPHKKSHLSSFLYFKNTALLNHISTKRNLPALAPKSFFISSHFYSLNHSSAKYGASHTCPERASPP